MKPFAMKPYPIHNACFNNLGLDEQIEEGCNNYAVEGLSGCLYFGKTPEEALKAAKVEDQS